MTVSLYDCVTLWYRPPELLIGTNEYSYPVDVWSAGVVIYEMLAGKAFLKGKDEDDMLRTIEQRIGDPTVAWPAIKQEPRFEFIGFGNADRSTDMEDAKRKSPLIFSLLEKMLVWDPSQRITAHGC